MTFSELKESLNLSIAEYSVRDISHELWREYEHGGRVYRIENPIALIIRNAGTTHRIVDGYGISHCHPIPGRGTALRWFNGLEKPPVVF